MRLLINKGRRFPLVPLGLLGVCVLGAGVVQYSYQSDYFLLDEIALQGEQRIKEERLMGYLKDKAGIAEGVSLITFSAREVEELITQLPEVESVRARKAWPNELRIEIDEHDPAGIYVSGKSSLLFNEDGLLFARTKTSDFREGELPILTGMEGSANEIGRTLPGKAVNTALTYADVFEKASATVANKVSEFYWGEHSGLVVVATDGTRFRCGTRPPSETGPVIETLMERRKYNQIAEANLVASNHVTVEWQQDGPIAAGTED